MVLIWALIRLIRLDSSLLGFLAVFVPVTSRIDACTGFGRSLPLLFICASTFVANDLNDLERDKTNHPTRPLVVGSLPKSAAAAIYFVALGGALFSIKYEIEPRIAVWYYALTCLAISYGLVTDYLPSIKACYAGILVAMPLLIVGRWFPDEPRLNWLALALFLLAAGRELCMNIMDGDGENAGNIPSETVTWLTGIAFFAQFLGAVVLISTAGTVVTFTAASIVLLLVVLVAVGWFRFEWRRIAIALMKVQFAFGLALLL